MLAGSTLSRSSGRSASTELIPSGSASLLSGGGPCSFVLSGISRALLAVPQGGGARKTKKRLLAKTPAEPATNEAAGPGTEATDKDAEAPPKKANVSKDTQEQIVVKVVATEEAKPKVKKAAKSQKAAPETVQPPLKSALKSSTSSTKKVKFAEDESKEAPQVSSEGCRKFEDESSDEMAPPPVSMFSG